ncbi:MAG: DUF357 domain-containing protein [archaeon]
MGAGFKSETGAKIKDRVTKEEILKWLDKLEPLLPGIEPMGEKGGEFMANILAYVHDCKHFMEKGDYVNSFEAIIWAWSWYEIGLNNSILRQKEE